MQIGRLTTHSILTALFAAAITLATAAQSQSAVEVVNAWTRATVAAQKIGGVYMDIRSQAPARLIAAASPLAARAEIHNMKMEGGVMKMSPVDGIALMPGQTVVLAPGGYHVMLIDLKRALKPGDSVPLSLTIERADKTRTTVEVKAAVRDMSGAMQGGHDAHKGR